MILQKNPAGSVQEQEQNHCLSLLSQQVHGIQQNHGDSVAHIGKQKHGAPVGADAPVITADSREILFWRENIQRVGFKY